MEREEVHKKIMDIFEVHQLKGGEGRVSQLFKHEKHFAYLYSFLTSHTIYPFFDVQKPWLIYWSVNALHILREDNAISFEDRRFLAEYVLSFQSPEGGFCGGQGYPPNMATTYASVLALASLDLPEYFDRINRKNMKKFLISCRADTPGAYRVHHFGETDLRCTFIAVLIASSLNILDDSITNGVLSYVQACQSYEGGISPTPEVEAHGGYTFCGVATLALLGSLEKLNLKKLLFWLASMQTEYGGFCGRTNKLVDSCYSFWQTTSFHIIKDYFSKRQTLFTITEGTDSAPSKWQLNLKDETSVAYNVNMLQKYILLCCQGSKGGLQDKPTKSVDIYHTMYALSGLGLSSHEEGLDPNIKLDWSDYFLDDVDPIFNIPRELAQKFTEHFRNC